MTLRKTCFVLSLCLSAGLLLEDVAQAQRGGRTSGSTGSSQSSSGGRSGGTPSYSGGSRSSSSGGSSRGGFPSSSSSRSSSRSSASPSTPSYSPPAVSAPSRTSSTTSRSSRDSYRDSSRDTSRYSDRSTTSAATPRIDLSGTDSRSRVELNRTDSTRTSTPSTYDLSRRGSTFDSNASRSRTGTLEDATIYVSDRPSRVTRRGSTVPQLYGSSRSNLNLPAEAQRRALSDRLRSASTISSNSRTEAAGLVERYSPSSNRLSRTPRTSSGLISRTNPREDVTLPGRSSRIAAAKLSESDRQESHLLKRGAEARDKTSNRIASARKSAQSSEALAADSVNWERMRDRYQKARSADPELSKKMAEANEAVAIASDIGLRTALKSTPFTSGVASFGGGYSNPYGTGYGGNSNGWGGYGYGGWSNWYWNSCFPFYCNWWFGCTSGWFPGWGWGYGHCYSWGYKPYWGWSCYYPYSYKYYWPTYAYVSPTIVYNYYEVDTPVESVAPSEPVMAVSAPAASSSSLSDFGIRASAEYMALGDRAFTEGRYGDAVHYYAKAIEFAPEDGVLYLVLSDALFATGDYHYAAFALRRALELHPELVSLGLDKRTFYGDPADFDRQLVLLEKFVNDHVIDDDARLVLAANYHFSRQSERCVELLDGAFSIDVKASPAGQLILASTLELIAKQN